MAAFLASARASSSASSETRPSFLSCSRWAARCDGTSTSSRRLLGLGLKVEQLPVERQGQARFLVGLRGDAVLRREEVEPRGAGVQLDDGVAHAHGVAGPLEDAEHAAFEGGDDRPLGRRHDHACRVQRRFDPPELATRPMRSRDRATDGRSHPGSNAKAAITRIADTVAIDQRFTRRRRHGRVVERSIHVSPLRFVRAIAMPGSPGVKRRRDVWCASRTVRFPHGGVRFRILNEGTRAESWTAPAPSRIVLEWNRRLEASRLTAYDLASLPDDERRHGLEEGWLVSEPLPSLRHDRVRRTLERILEAHVANHGLGEVFGEAGFVLARNPDTVRGPDLSFVARERLVGIDYGRFFDGAPDLAIEILSPSNRPGQVRAKVADYLAAGCHLVWVVDPEARTVTTYRSLLSPRVLRADDALDGIDLLPGLTIQVASIFEVSTSPTAAAPTQSLPQLLARTSGPATAPVGIHVSGLIECAEARRRAACRRRPPPRQSPTPPHTSHSYFGRTE